MPAMHRQPSLSRKLKAMQRSTNRKEFVQHFRGGGGGRVVVVVVVVMLGSSSSST